MAELPSAFNSEEVDDDFEVVPAGMYPMEIVKSEMKDTRAGTGKYLNLQMKIISGKYKGKVVFDMLNLVNPNETAVEIARKTLKKICDATGKKKIADSKVLHNIPMNVRLDIKEADDNWPAKNIVKGYSALEGAGAAGSAAPKGGNPFGDDKPVSGDT